MASQYRLSLILLLFMGELFFTSVSHATAQKKPRTYYDPEAVAMKQYQYSRAHGYRNRTDISDNRRKSFILLDEAERLRQAALKKHDIALGNTLLAKSRRIDDLADRYFNENPPTKRRRTTRRPRH